jgi:hypothetical protein
MIRSCPSQVFSLVDRDQYGQMDGVRVHPGRLSALHVLPSKSLLDGAFAWVGMALNIFEIVIDKFKQNPRIFNKNESTTFWDSYNFMSPPQWHKVTY